VCNRYEQRGSVSQIRKLAHDLNRNLQTSVATDNLPPQDNVYPDQDAPVIRNLPDGSLGLMMYRWGFPPIPSEKSPITNIRNLQSNWWKDVNRQWITEKIYRCLVPFTAFAEPVRDSTWFVVPNVEVPCFAGFWRHWEGERLAEVPGQKRRLREQRKWDLFAFLTTDANDVVRPIQAKAMPVILIDSDEQSEWLSGGDKSFHLQRPLPNESLQIRA